MPNPSTAQHNTAQHSTTQHEQHILQMRGGCQHPLATLRRSTTPDAWLTKHFDIERTVVTLSLIHI
eukprot:4005036-Alexandrium_andersonii.AAC.1